MMTEGLYGRVAYPYERVACPVSNLSVAGFAATAPLVGEPLAGRRVFGVWRFAPFGSAGVMFGPAAEVALGADRRKSAPITQRSNGGALSYYNGFRLLSLGASGAFASSAFAAGSARAAGAAAGFGACFTTGAGGVGSSFRGKRVM